MATEPLASGGYVSFIPGEKGSYYEVHTFMDAGEYTLSFADTSLAEIEADILVVGGGGGSGGDHNSTKVDFSGGGGAGGLVYKTNYNFALANGVVSVVVGAGGDGVSTNAQGADGGESRIGSGEQALCAPGGGGGGGYSNLAGRPGGSGGGGSAGTSNTYGNGGDVTADVAGFLGHAGGRGGNANSTDAGGGGGGAGSAGGVPTGSGQAIPGEGGEGWQPPEDWYWVTEVTGAAEFSHGGRGGGPNCDRVDGANFGDGGSGGNGVGQPGGAGHAGIVIVRFQRTVENQP